MKKLLAFMFMGLVLFSCSKDDSPATPVTPNETVPSPTTGDVGTGYVDGVKSISTFGTGKLVGVGNTVVLFTQTGNFHVWFKEKPMVGTYTIKSYIDVYGNKRAANEAGFVFLPKGAGTDNYGSAQYWSTNTSSGTVIVTESGSDLIIEAKGTTACVHDYLSIPTNNCRTFSAFYKIPKPK